MQASIWEKETFLEHKDVIIVGGGFTGLWSAYYLKKLHPKWTITILERGIIPTGASTRNAGFACFGSVTELVDDARKMGEDNMLNLVTMRYEGICRIKKMFHSKDIDFEKTGGYELIAPHQYDSFSTLKNDIGWLNILLRKALGEKKVFKIADKKIKTFELGATSHLIENTLEGQLHAAKLLIALQSKVVALGVHIFNGVEVSSFQKNNGQVWVHSNLSEKLTCNQLLICTNAFAKALLPDIQIVPARGQVLVTAPLKKLPFKGTFHFDEGFYYFRNIGNRVLLGGARNASFETEATSEMNTTEIIQSKLESFLSSTILPHQNFTITHRWSGIMGMAKSKTPIVKKIKNNIYCAVGMSGMGVALAPMLGEVIARKMSE